MLLFLTTLLHFCTQVSHNLIATYFGVDIIIIFMDEEEKINADKLVSGLLHYFNALEVAGIQTISDYNMSIWDKNI